MTAVSACARPVSRLWFALAVIGAFVGVYMLWLHVTTDPLIDVHAYYDAAARLKGLPIAWSVAIGQAQVPLTLLTAIAAPWSIALAAHLKLFPTLIALWWIGRREWRRLAVFVAWAAGLVMLQLVLAPQATLDFLTALTLKEVGAVRNFSPYALSPLLWAALVVIGVAVTLRLARTRWGWSAAVALSVLASPPVRQARWVNGASMP
ncbi:MAG TPA: glycosyltransferase 87 family protein [Candidatus Limnocylindrales bacterium]